MTTTILPGEVAALREKHYDARVVGLRRVHESLIVARVCPDRPLQPFAAGQYTTLGLGEWERGPEDDLLDRPPPPKPKLIRRTYSLSCPILNQQNEVVPPSEWPFWEFYIAIVPPRAQSRPLLTPKLARLQVGSRLKAGPKVAGKYTLEAVEPHQDVVFLATGTGEAPHNAMIAELLANGHRGRIASFVCARYQRDLAYRKLHQRLMKQFPNYRSFAFSTRDAAKKRYLQARFLDGDLERESGFRWSPDETHLFLCGNPAMIGGHSLDDPTAATGMLDLLTRRGFQQAGTLHAEKYW